MAPKKRQPSAQEYRDSLPPDRQEWWDSVTGRTRHQVPEKPVSDENDGRGLTIGVVSVLIFITLHKCWDVLSSMKPDESWSGAVAWVLLTFFIVWYLIWEIKETIKDKRKELVEGQGSPAPIAEEEETPEEKKGPVWGEEECRQWWEKKVSASPASQSRSELIEEWEKVEKEWEIAEEIRKYEEEEKKRMEEMEREQWEQNEPWSGYEEPDLGDYDEESHDSIPRNDDPDHYDYEPDMDDGE